MNTNRYVQMYGEANMLRNIESTQSAYIAMNHSNGEALVLALEVWNMTAREYWDICQASDLYAERGE